MKHKVALFDADGVLTIPEDYFSNIYAKSRGIDPKSIEPFFKGDFRLASVGKADLKDLLVEAKDIWQTDDVEGLMKLWFESENVINQPLIDHIQTLRQSGTKCYVASVQEKYRAEYFREVMFKDLFDGFYISCDLGVMKPEPKFFELIIEDLRNKGEIDSANDVVFVDDNQENVDGATSVGIDSFFYHSLQDTVSRLS